MPVLTAHLCRTWQGQDFVLCDSGTSAPHLIISAALGSSLVPESSSLAKVSINRWDPESSVPSSGRSVPSSGQVPGGGPSRVATVSGKAA